MTLRGRWGACGIVVLTLAVAGIGSRGAAAGGEDAPAAMRPGSGPIILRGDGRARWFAIFSPDGKTFATSCDDGTIRLWDTAARSEKAVLTGHNKDTFSVAFAPDGGTLASTGADGTIRLWDVRTLAGGAPRK